MDQSKLDTEDHLRSKKSLITRNATTTTFKCRRGINKTFTEIPRSPKNSILNRSLSKPSLQSTTHYSSSKYQLQKFNTLIVPKPHSNIPSGLSTFIVLEAIYSKDCHFHIPVPNTVIMNCGFEKIILIDSVKNLKIIPALDINQAIRHLRNFYPGNSAILKYSSNPVAILKYKESKLLEFTMSNLLNSFPDTKVDTVIQKFIMPKGLRVSKYRVILNEFKRVLILNNNSRIDAKPERTCKAANKTESVDINLIRTVAMHNDVSKVLKNNLEWHNITRLNGNFIDRMKSFQSFMQNNNFVKDEEKFEESRPTARYITSGSSDKTSLFVGTNQSFAEIIKITEYLRAKIDYYYLDSTKLSELACDFMQDKAGNWFFIKIKYGKTEQKNFNLKWSQSVRKKKRIVLKSSLDLGNQHET